ncbi:MAG: hypothetical protein WC216_10200 [Gallionella sp.]|jgi:hypothetical protein
MFSKSEPLGKTLIALGCLSLVVGLLSGISKSILEIWNEIENFGPQYAIAPPPPAEWLQAVGSLIKTIAEAAINLLIAFRESPIWLVLIFIGIALMLMGLWVMPNMSKTNNE